jgi:uncharacterized metal-binding protein
MLLMLVFFHVVIALTSIGFTALTFFIPSQIKIKTSQALIALTLGSGTYLVISTHANMVSSCVSGLIYTAIVVFGIAGASRKLVADKSIE